MIVIHKAGVEFIEAIQRLAITTWAVAYAAILPPDQMDYMLNLFYSNKSLHEQMNSGHRFILVSDNSLHPEENRWVGFASYSFIPDSLTEPAEMLTKLYRLHKIYIHPGHQGKGIGKILLNTVINEIRPDGATDLELNVNRGNRAVEFYKKLGFEIIRQEDINIGNGYFMNDYVMNLSLNQPAVPNFKS